MICNDIREFESKIMMRQGDNDFDDDALYFYFLFLFFLIFINNGEETFKTSIKMIDPSGEMIVIDKLPYSDCTKLTILLDKMEMVHLSDCLIF